jgi:hypothetical protein
MPFIIANNIKDKSAKAMTLGLIGGGNVGSTFVTPRTSWHAPSPRILF